MSVPLVDNDLTKAAGDTVRLGLDLGALPQIVAGATVSGAPTITATPSGLTISGPAKDTDYRVSALFAGGTGGSDYAVTWTVSLSSGETIARVTTLHVV